MCFFIFVFVVLVSYIILCVLIVFSFRINNCVIKFLISSLYFVHVTEFEIHYRTFIINVGNVCAAYVCGSKIRTFQLIKSTYIY